jgi:hypothetical protein
LYQLTHDQEEIFNRPTDQKKEDWMKLIDASKKDLKEFCLLNCEMSRGTRDLNEFYDKPLVILSTLAFDSDGEILKTLNLDKLFDSISEFPILKNELKRELTSFVDFTIEDTFQQDFSIEYYLIRDKPQEAFELIQSRFGTSLVDPYDQQETESKFFEKRMNQEEQQELLNEVKEIALNHLKDDYIITSCRIFLEVFNFIFLNF